MRLDAFFAQGPSRCTIYVDVRSNSSVRAFVQWENSAVNVFINPRHACAAKVTVVVPCVSDGLSVMLFSATMRI